MGGGPGARPAGNGPWPEVTDAVRRVMKGNKGKGTKPELTVRRMLHALGYRYRLHRRTLPGSPDIVFPSRRVAVQVHGCFWHQHPGCRHARVPATRAAYWGPKLARNVERDRRDEALLEGIGWRQVTVWECELADPAQVAASLQGVLGPAGATPPPMGSGQGR